MSDTKKPDDVVTLIGREIAAMHGALLALTSVVARSGDGNAIVFSYSTASGQFAIAVPAAVLGKSKRPKRVTKGFGELRYGDA